MAKEVKVERVDCKIRELNNFISLRKSESRGDIGWSVKEQ